MHMAATMRGAGALALAMAVVAMATTTAMAQNSAQDFLDLHNAARAEVGVGQVWWDKTLQTYAEGYANQRRGDCALTHSQGSGYGENIFKGFGNWPYTGIDAVNMWVSEKESYDYNSNTCSPDAKYGTCGHYTQVVWRDTTWIGCARVNCDNGRGVFITCNYYPPGNWAGQWPYLAARSAA